MPSNARACLLRERRPAGGFIDTVLDDAHDEGWETLTLRRSNASGSRRRHGDRNDRELGPDAAGVDDALRTLGREPSGGRRHRPVRGRRPLSRHGEGGKPRSVGAVRDERLRHAAVGSCRNGTRLAEQVRTKTGRELLLGTSFQGEYQNSWGQSSRHRRLNVETLTSNARSPFRRRTVSTFDPAEFGASFRGQFP